MPTPRIHAVLGDMVHGGSAETTSLGTPAAWMMVSTCWPTPSLDNRWPRRYIHRCPRWSWPRSRGGTSARGPTKAAKKSGGTRCAVPPYICVPNLTQGVSSHVWRHDQSASCIAVGRGRRGDGAVKIGEKSERRRGVIAREDRGTLSRVQILNHRHGQQTADSLTIRVSVPPRPAAA